MIKLLFYFGGFMPVGGIEVFAKNLITGLINYPLSIDLLTWGKKSLLLNEICSYNNVKNYRFFWRWGCRFGIPDKLILPFGKLLVKKSNLVIFGKTFSPEIHFTLEKIKKMHKIPFVYITPYRPRELWSESLPEQTLKNIQKMLNTFNCIIVQAKIFADDLLNLGYKGRIEVIPYVPAKENPVNHFPNFQNVMRIGFLGRLEKAKNIDYLLNSFSIIINTKIWTKNRLELHIFGDGSEKTRLAKLVKALNISSFVHFHGSIPYSKVKDTIDFCHLFVFSSLTEGQCIAALEILSRGRPIVATPVGALPDIIQDDVGNIVPLNEPQIFAQTILHSLQKVTNGEFMPEKIRKYYNSYFSRDKIIAKYWELICDLTKESR